MKRTAAIATIAATTLAASAVAGTADATAHRATGPSYATAISHPVVDSYYPKYGVAYLDTLHYGLALDWQPKTKRLSGTATIVFRVTTKRTTVRFDLGAPLKVSKVVLDGRRVTARHSGNYLTINTGVLKGNSRHKVAITYAGRPALVQEPAQRSDVQLDGFHITKQGDVYAYQEPYGAFTWYPVNDQPSDKAFYDARLTSHDGQRGVFNGQVTSSVTRHGTTTTTFHLDQPASSYLTTIAFGHYTHQVVKGPHGLPINYWYTAADKAVLPVIRKTPQIIAWAEKQLGRYPFASTGVVLVPGNSAMETQTLVTMSNSVSDMGGMDGYRQDYAHELLHSWFGDEITPTDWKDLWLNESLTMFMQFRYMAANKLPNDYGSWSVLQNGYDQYLRDSEGPAGAYHKNDFGDLNVYLSGALLLHNLQVAYGTKRFDAALRGWPATHRYHNAGRSQFIAYMNKALGPKAGPYISTWLTAKKTPKPLPKQR